MVLLCGASDEGGKNGVGGGREKIGLCTALVPCCGCGIIGGNLGSGGDALCLFLCLASPFFPLFLGNAHCLRLFGGDARSLSLSLFLLLGGRFFLLLLLGDALCLCLSIGALLRETGGLRLFGGDARGFSCLPLLLRNTDALGFGFSCCGLLSRFGDSSGLCLGLGLEGINVLGCRLGNEASEERIGAGDEGDRVFGVIEHKSAVGLVECNSLFSNRYLLCFTSAFRLLFGSDA